MKEKKEAWKQTYHTPSRAEKSNLGRVCKVQVKGGETAASLLLLKLSLGVFVTAMGQVSACCKRVLRSHYLLHVIGEENCVLYEVITIAISR